ncbi:hypothetical protein P8452_38554 [Trifolium repens]|nr:hypothetical protein P8452_38554 [Trifolium repens]
MIIPYTSSLTFNFTSFDPNDRSIIYEGSANPASSAIQLTINQQDSQNRKNYGDGIAFFLIPSGTKKPNATKGGSMGLTLDDQALNSTQTNPFVAVEFDIYQNPWDPPLEHAGIDINSMISVANLTWLADIKEEFVTVGFSAATGNATAIHSISSWDFSSTLESQQDNNKTNIEDPNIAPSSKKKKSKAGLAVGLGIGGFVLIAVFGLISFYLWKKLKKGKEEEDGDFEEYMGEDFGRGGPKKYTYAELAHAANNFKDEHKLGQGGFGGVYRGFLKDTKSYVAIKRVSEDSHQGIKEFASEVTIISKLRHRNLVQLIAPLPNLPSSMPVPTYLEGPLNSFTAPFSISGSETSQSQNIISFSSNTNSSGFTTTTTSTTSDDVSPSLSLLYSRRN